MRYPRGTGPAVLRRLRGRTELDRPAGGRSGDRGERDGPVRCGGGRFPWGGRGPSGRGTLRGVPGRRVGGGARRGTARPRRLRPGNRRRARPRGRGRHDRSGPPPPRTGHRPGSPPRGGPLGVPRSCRAAPPPSARRPYGPPARRRGRTAGRRAPGVPRRTGPTALLRPVRDADGPGGADRGAPPALVAAASGPRQPGDPVGR